MKSAIGLLKSGLKSDVQLALDVLHAASEHELAAAESGKHAMLPLIWRSEEYQKIVLASFHDLHLKVRRRAPQRSRSRALVLLCSFLVFSLISSSCSVPF